MAHPWGNDWTPGSLKMIRQKGLPWEGAVHTRKTSLYRPENTLEILCGHKDWCLCKPATSKIWPTKL